MKINFLLISFAIFSLTSCRKAAIKPDPENPYLPAYSEKGLNAGGILINDRPWLTLETALFSTSRPLNLLSYPNGDSIVVLLNGSYKNSSLQNEIPKTIFIVIKNIKIENDSDLIQLNSKSYPLDGSINYGGFSDHYGYNKTGNSVGNISFGKVEGISNVTYGDGSPNNPIKHPYIVSGHLEMTFSATINYVLKKGRFDVNIVSGRDQFVVY